MNKILPNQCRITTRRSDLIIYNLRDLRALHNMVAKLCAHSFRKHNTKEYERLTLKSLGRPAMLFSLGRGVRLRQVGQEIPFCPPPPLPFQLLRHSSQKVCWHCSTLGALKGSKHTMHRKKSSKISVDVRNFSAMIWALSSTSSSTAPPSPPTPSSMIIR